jgi:hypothetical protein
MRWKVKLHLWGNFSTFLLYKTMTFLNPIMLFGLAAAAIPILLHLLNLRKLKTVEFSSLRFLRELQRTRMRKIRLRQWILLLLRTLLVLCLVLAFSRPALQGSLASLGGGSARSAIVLLIDDSPSMALRNAGGILFDQTKASARRIIALARPGDEIHVIPLSTVPSDNEGPAAVSPHEALRIVDGMQISNRFSRCAPAIRYALQRTRTSAAVNKEFYLLSDLQGTTFAPDSSRQDDDAGGDAGDVRLFIAPFPPAGRENAAVIASTVESRILAQNRPVTVRALVQNFGDSPLPNAVVSLYIEGTRVAQQSVAIAARSRAPVELTGVPKRRGILGCSVRIEDDVLEIDNRRHFAIAIPETVAVLVAGDTPASTRFASLALSLAGDSSVAGLFRIRQIAAERLMTADIEGADVLLLSAGRALPQGAGARIASAVRNGMGLLIFPGPDTDAAGLSRSLLEPLGIPAISTPPPRPENSEASSFLRFGTTDLSHPVFAGMFEQTAVNTASPSIESPHITSAATLAPGPGAATLIGMTDGRPFLLEYRSGNGRVIMCAVDAGMAWSDLPVRGIFAPLLHRSMVYLSTATTGDTGSRVGDRLTLSLPRASGESRREFAIVSPDGSEERVVPHIRAGALFFTSSSAELPGVYTLRDARASRPGAAPAVLQAAAVNSRMEESDLVPATDGMIAACATACGIAAEHIRELPGAEGLERAVGEARYGVELWQTFLLLALLCAALEMVIARTTRSAAGEGQQDA